MKSPRYASRSEIRLLQAAPALLAVALCGCKMFGGRAEPPQPEPVLLPAAPQEIEAEELPPPDLSAVIEMMEQGRGGAAAEYLRLILARDPGAPGARGLLDQIERDPRELLGHEYLESIVQPGDTLAGLAREYLENPLLFFALARYNDIPVPRRLEVGQLLKIPLGGDARRNINDKKGGLTEQVEIREADSFENAESGMVAESAAAGVQIGAAQATGFEKLLVEQYHDHALRAWRDRRVGEAISLWEDLLAMDPDFQPAHVYLGRAYELQLRLTELDDSAGID